LFFSSGFEGEESGPPADPVQVAGNEGGVREVVRAVLVFRKNSGQESLDWESVLGLPHRSELKWHRFELLLFIVKKIVAVKN
jgi:hypothetical protein